MSHMGAFDWVVRYIILCMCSKQFHIRAAWRFTLTACVAMCLRKPRMNRSDSQMPYHNPSSPERQQAEQMTSSAAAVSHFEFMLETHETDMSAKQFVKWDVATEFSARCTPVGSQWPLAKHPTLLPGQMDFPACINWYVHTLSFTYLDLGLVQHRVILFLLSLKQ